MDKLIKIPFISWCDCFVCPEHGLFSHQCCHCWNAPPTTSHCTHIHGLHQHSASVDECYWLQCFSHRGIQCHTFAWYALPCQMPLCQTAPLQPSVMQHQHVMEYQWEGSASTAIPPTSASEVIGWHYKKEGITFGAAFVHLKCLPRSQFKWHSNWPLHQSYSLVAYTHSTGPW